MGAPTAPRGCTRAASGTRAGARRRVKVAVAAAAAAPPGGVVVVPRGAGEVVPAPHPGHVPAREVPVGEALEERRGSAAAQEEEHVVRVRRQVRLPPRLEDEAVAPAPRGAVECAAVGHGRVVQGEAPVGVVDVEDAVGARGEVQHQRAVDAEEQVAEPRVAAPGVQRERVVHRDVAAEGPARRDRDVGGGGGSRRRHGGARA